MGDSHDGHDHDDAPVCGESFDMQISLHGFNATVKRTMDYNETKVVLSGFKYLPVVTTEGQMVTIKAGESCEAADDSASVAFSIAGLASYAMGYPMATAAVLLSANLLPVNADEACELTPIMINIYTMAANATVTEVEVTQSDD